MAESVPPHPRAGNHISEDEELQREAFVAEFMDAVKALNESSPVQSTASTSEQDQPNRTQFLETNTEPGYHTRGASPPANQQDSPSLTSRRVKTSVEEAQECSATQPRARKNVNSRSSVLEVGESSSCPRSASSSKGSSSSTSQMDTASSDQSTKSSDDPDENDDTPAIGSTVKVIAAAGVVLLVTTRKAAVRAAVVNSARAVGAAVAEMSTLAPAALMLNPVTCAVVGGALVGWGLSKLIDHVKSPQ